jgi:hypothetical protein
MRSERGTRRKQSRAMLAALSAGFLCNPFPIAWGT